MIPLGISSEYAEKCVETNRHNHVTTTYYLLLKKYILAGNKSIAGNNEIFYIFRYKLRII